MLILQLYNSSEFPATFFGHFWMKPYFRFFFWRKDCRPNLNEFQQSKLHNNISAGAYRQYTHIDPCVQVQLKYGKMIHFLFPEKAFLHQLIGMTFFLSFFYLLLFHNSDGVTGLFFPINMHLGTMKIQHHHSAIATTFFGWRLCNFPLPVFTLL